MSSPSDAANEGAAAASRSRSADTRGGGKKKFDFTGGMRFSTAPGPRKHLIASAPRSCWNQWQWGGVDALACRWHLNDRT